MPLHVLERPAAGEAKGALVLLHGRGADEHDLFPLLDALDPERRLQGYTPRAPLSLPGKFTMSAVPRVTACARDKGAIGVFASDAARITSPIPTAGM